jgi:hypothetical protein
LTTFPTPPAVHAKEIYRGDAEDSVQNKAMVAQFASIRHVGNEDEMFEKSLLIVGHQVS